MLKNRVRSLRDGLGLTQEDFAARVGVDISTVQRWEGRTCKPSPLAMKRMRDLFVEHQQSKTKSTETSTESDRGHSTQTGPVRRGFLPSMS